MKLRYYQLEAVEAAVAAIAKNHNPVLQLATGTGKSLIISALAEHYARRKAQVWVLTHVQQLVGQNAATYKRYTGDNPAIVCAGIGRKDLSGDVTFGTIQSVIRASSEMKEPDLIIIDEAHRVPHNDGEPTLYESILRRYPSAGRIAMTATPWRMDNGIIYGKGDRFWFDKLAYTYTVPQAVKDGYLCPLVGVETAIQLDVDDVTVQGDFTQSEVEQIETEAWLGSVAKSILNLASKRKHVAVYCPTINTAKSAAEIIKRVTGWETDVMVSGMNSTARERTLKRFEEGTTRVLCSVDMITTGFDFPALDCIACLRPTLSSSLWVQIQGRGTRIHPDKKNCLVLDYVGNLIRLGGVDMYDTFYREKGLVEVEAVPSRPYIKRERKVYPGVCTLKPINPMTGEDAEEGDVILATVHAVNVIAIATRRKPGIPVLLVQYTCSTPEGARIDASTFINTETPNRETLEFFDLRSLAVTLPSPAASLIWQVKNARRPRSVSIRKSGRYFNVVEEHFNIPEE